MLLFSCLAAIISLINVSVFFPGRTCPLPFQREHACFAFLATAAIFRIIQIRNRL